MKRKLVMLLTIVAVLAVGIGIWYNVPINLMDLEHDEVIEIVVFNGNTGNATHITDETQIEHIIENLNEIKLKRSKPSVGYSKRKNLSRALFQGRCGQQQNRQKIFCTARDLRQAWCQPSLKMFMCMRVGVS